LFTFVLSLERHVRALNQALQLYVAEVTAASRDALEELRQDMALATAHHRRM